MSLVERTVTDPHTGKQRPYWEYKPDSYVEGNPALMGIHGSGGSALEFFGMASLQLLADEGGYLIILPDDPHGWGNKDLEYLYACLVEAKRHLPGEVFGCGHSSGAGIITRLAYYYNGSLDAICAVSCGSADDVVENYDPKVYQIPVSLLKVNSAYDNPGGRYEHACVFVRLYAWANGFRKAGFMNGEVLNENPRVIRHWYEDDRSRVEFVSLHERHPQDKDHSWPKGERGYNATAAMYEFFENLRG